MVCLSIGGPGQSEYFSIFEQFHFANNNIQTGCRVQIVQLGDTVNSIAAANSLSLDDFPSINSGIQKNGSYKLKVGGEVAVGPVLIVGLN